MKIAIISDIHANVEALTAVLAAIERTPVDSIVCLGDVVGYGSNPNECIAIVRERCAFTLLGNHDAAAIRTKELNDFTPRARAAIEWTALQLMAESSVFLQSLPYTHAQQNCFFVHASPHVPNQWNYVFQQHEANEALASFQEPICFIGHTHVPAIFSVDGRERSVTRGKRLLVNVGSVGQPRDGNPKASFAFFDTETWEYRLTRVVYDIETAAKKIRAAGLPRELADRLFIGV